MELDDDSDAVAVAGVGVRVQVGAALGVRAAGRGQPAVAERGHLVALPPAEITVKLQAYKQRELEVM